MHTPPLTWALLVLCTSVDIVTSIARPVIQLGGKCPKLESCCPQATQAKNLCEYLTAVCTNCINTPPTNKDCDMGQWCWKPSYKDICDAQDQTNQTDQTSDTSSSTDPNPSTSTVPNPLMEPDQTQNRTQPSGAAAATAAPAFPGGLPSPLGIGSDPCGNGGCQTREQYCDAIEAYQHPDNANCGVCPGTTTSKKKLAYVQLYSDFLEGGQAGVGRGVGTGPCCTPRIQCHAPATINTTDLGCGCQICSQLKEGERCDTTWPMLGVLAAGDEGTGEDGGGATDTETANTGIASGNPVVLTGNATDDQPYDGAYPQ